MVLGIDLLLELYFDIKFPNTSSNFFVSIQSVQSINGQYKLI